MKMQEVINILEDDKNKNKLEEISKKLYMNCDYEIINILSRFDIIWDEEKSWTYSKEKIDLSLNLIHEIYFPETSKPKSEYKWSVGKELTNYDEVKEIILLIQKSSNASYNIGKSNITNSISLRKITLYIVAYLDHPLDGLFITKEHIASSLGYANIRSWYLMDLIKTVCLCICLKKNIRLPFELASGIFYSFKFRSLIHSDRKYSEKGYRLNPFTEALINYVKDGEVLLKEVELVWERERMYLSSKRGGNIFYFIVMFLLERNTNVWKSLKITDLTIKNCLHLYQKNYLGDSNGISSLNFIFYLKNKTHNMFRNTYFDDLLKGEIEYYFTSYYIYLKFNKRSRTLYHQGMQVFSHKPSSVRTISELTKDNLKEWIQAYSEYSLLNNRKHYVTRLQAFLKLLLKVKELFENGNILEVNTQFPFSFEDIGSVDYKLTTNENDEKYHESLYYFVSDELKKQMSGIEDENKGTLKLPIEHADKIVRAIYSYTIECEEGTDEYFNELQKTVMLRILADSGVRVNEVINMPFGTHSFVEEHGVHICILGWSKFFERFGVVPIGKQTADMLKQVHKIRKEQYTSTLIPMPMSYKGGTKDASLNYVKQFVTVHNTGHVRNVSDLALSKHLDKICVKAGLTQISGKKFHFFRHRAAEYFFFCTSYYDFDGKSDELYKEIVVKKLLRHVDVEMTKEYYWGDLLRLIGEKKLVFYKDLSDISKYIDDGKNYGEAKYHKDSIIRKINNDLQNFFTKPNLEKIIKLFTVPIDFVSENILSDINNSQNFGNLIKHLTKVDGNKSPVPPGGAYFGRCMNFSCPKLKEKITCVSCNEHIVTEEDIPRIVGEIIRCNSHIQYIYRNYDEKVKMDHVKSLRSRVASNINKLQQDLQKDSFEIMNLLEEYVLRM